eukprot:2501265-Pyramimonas_sp.AAC.1
MSWTRWRALSYYQPARTRCYGRGEEPRRVGDWLAKLAVLTAADGCPPRLQLSSAVQEPRHGAAP